MPSAIFLYFFFPSMQLTSVSVSVNYISKKAFRLSIRIEKMIKFFCDVPQFFQEMTEQYFMLVISQNASHNVYKIRITSVFFYLF
jgi:hypothetical protein